jgi:hypothetical protein
MGEVAPFFLRRVFHLELGSATSPKTAKRAVQGIAAALQKPLSRIRRSAALLEMQVCRTCTFVQTKHGFSDESLSNLYRDYRSESYNKERIHYEPSYRPVAARVGADQKELEVRTRAVTEWLQPRMTVNGSLSMLDYGGADGRFLPRLRGAKFVYEISDVRPADGIVSIRREADLESYTYVQLAHVLEHVSRPLEMVHKVSRLVAPGGYLYIEVPQDFSDTKIDQMSAGSYRGSVPIHEHINLYNVRSVRRLVESANLQVIGAESVAFDLGWCTCTNVRALGKKT